VSSALITNDLPLTLSMQLLSSLEPHETLNFHILFSMHNDNHEKLVLMADNCHSMVHYE